MKKFTVLLAMFASLLLFGSHVASANDTDSKFNVSVVKSDKMRGDTSRAWFDLKMNPSEKTTLHLELTNRGDKAATFIIAATQAETQTNMAMVADRSISDVQSSVIPSLQLGSNILTVPETKVTLAAGDTREITAQVNMPSSKINGSWLGGIHIQKQVDSSDRVKNGYTNRFNYLCYVQLSNTDTVTKADLSLKKVSYEKKASAGQVDIKLQNDKAGYVADANSEVKIRQKGQSENVTDYKQTNQSIANGSVFTYQVPTDALKAGKTYVADITIHDNKNNLTWHWSQEFKVSMFLPVSGWFGDKLGKNYAWLWWLLALLALLIFLIIFFLLRRRRMVDIIEIVAGKEVQRRVAYKEYKKMLKDGMFVTLAKKVKK
ncbi:WxL protein host-binding domain-containing protein [Fructobacillus durionis]|uniref:Uncharacterized protein n=1 Tax=Fructobacillus durionis TaxID=283737 RepID=A0A1I1GRY2_9LACO|nr:DUF3324 domain-containing protein [Fructobacillus durionis]SFC14246.1 protein of unknown function [Fructobacillus durionis]